jgi:hypothetical protein
MRGLLMNPGLYYWWPKKICVRAAHLISVGRYQRQATASVNGHHLLHPGHLRSIRRHVLHRKGGDRCHSGLVPPRRCAVYHLVLFHHEFACMQGVRRSSSKCLAPGGAAQLGGSPGPRCFPGYGFRCSLVMLAWRTHMRFDGCCAQTVQPSVPGSPVYQRRLPAANYP